VDLKLNSMITNLRHNEIFVYGSNLHGINAGGAARQAEESFGAVPNIGCGRTGDKTYAIPTLDGNFQKLPLNVIQHYLVEFAEYARIYTHKNFFLTAVGTGIAGYSAEEMESIMPNFPRNVIKV
jgi:hypothetical protein